MTTIRSSVNFQTFTGTVVLTLTMFLSACGDGGTGECNGCFVEPPIVGNGVVTTFAGDGTASFLDDVGTAAQFSQPHDVTSDGTKLYIADAENHRIRQIVIATGEVTTLAGSGVSGFVDGTGTAAQFSTPRAITNDGINVYVADSSNHSIRQIIIATGEVSTLAGNGAAGFLDGTSTTAQFYAPQGIATDGTNLYIADTFNNRIRKIDATGEVTTLAGDGSEGALDGMGTAAQFNQLHKITSYGMDLYIADYANNSIRKVDMITGDTTTLARLSDVTEGISSVVTQGITTDGTNLYVSGFRGHISQIVIATGEVSTLAGGVLMGYLDGTGSAARFSNPQGITINGTDLYVADTYNNCIRRIELP